MKSSMLLGIAAAALLLAGCGEAKNGPKKLKIGVSAPSATHGWTGGILYHAEKAKARIEKANPDVEVIITSGQNTAEQVDRVENLLGRSPDALVVLSQEPAPLAPVLKQAKEKGAYLVIVSNPMPDNLADYFVNGDNRSLGAAAAEAMAKALDGKGDIVMMEGIPCPINTERVTAFTEAMKKYPGIRILDSKSANWNTEQGLKLMENFLQKYPKIDGVWAGDDDVMVGALKALEESKRTDVKAMIGAGGSKIMIGKVKAGDRFVKATVTYSPSMIADGIDIALAALRNGKKSPDGKVERLIESVIITQENADRYLYPDSPY